VAYAPPGGVKRACNGWHRQAKATKCGGMSGRESEHLVVPLKQGNSVPRETLWRKGDVVLMEPLKGKSAGKSCPGTVSTKQQRIAELAKQSPHMVLTTLAHHMDLEWLREAYDRTRKDGAMGVDGQTGKAYGVNLDENLGKLLEGAKSGLYKAPPVRRVHIPKGTGNETRPLGIPTFQDKVLQRAVVMLLEPIYEQDFWDCSYGFRPGRSAHQALEALWKASMRCRGWVIELDIRKFFDNLDHRHLREILQQRVGDGVVLRLIGKWLHAGVLEEGRITHAESGSPQGGVISPVLANVYLHEVLDTWFERTVKPCLRGKAHLIRYADDAVLAFEHEHDARRVLEVLPKRFAKYGLTLHPDKTRLVRFHPPRSHGRANDGESPGTFDFLGFTHFWAKSQKGNWVVKRQTAKSRYTRAVKALSQWCREHRHLPVAEQCRKLGQKLRGHYAYYGITGNTVSIRRFRHLAEWIWHKWLSRRSAKARIRWADFRQFRLRHWLPAAVLPRGRAWVCNVT
jgi:RNA-directed DNA polymerase